MSDLLDMLAAKPAAVRASDPPTSKAAAESLPAPVLSVQRHAVLAAVEAIERFNPHKVGATAYEVMARMAFTGHGPAQNIVARRLTDLRELGFVEDSGVTRPGGSNRPLVAWRITATGIEALAS